MSNSTIMSNCGAEHRGRRRRIGHLDDQLFIELVIERHDDRLHGVVHVPEDEFSVIEEQAGGQEARHLRANELQAVPPAPDLPVVDFDAGDVSEWDFQPAPQRPQFVQAFNVEHDAIALDGDVDHAERVACVLLKRPR